MKIHLCTGCGYAYDQNVGETEYGVEPGTTFEDLSNHWLCPVCTSNKNGFEKMLLD